MKAAILLLFFIFPLFSYSAIYKCKIDGVLTFSHLPCSDNAEEITIKTAQPGHSKANESDYVQNNNDIEAFIKTKKLNSQINESQNLIRTYKEKMSIEINDLNKMSQATANNLQGANRSEAIAIQMQSVTSKYKSLINVEQTKIDQLISQKKYINHSDITVNQDANEFEQALTETDQFIRLRKINSDIVVHENKIKTFQNQMKKEIKNLEKKSTETANNIAGASLQSAIANQMNALAAKYNTLIEVEQLEISRLLDEKNTLL